MSARSRTTRRCVALALLLSGIFAGCTTIKPVAPVEPPPPTITVDTAEVGTFPSSSPSPSPSFLPPVSPRPIPLDQLVPTPSPTRLPSAPPQPPPPPSPTPTPFVALPLPTPTPTPTATPTPRPLLVTNLVGSAEGVVDGVGTLAQFLSPNAIAVDSSGLLYVADTLARRVRKVDPNDPVLPVSTLAGTTAGHVDAPGAQAKFDGPKAVAVDVRGLVYVSDGSSVRRIDTNDVAKTVLTLAGSGTAHGYLDREGSFALFEDPGALAVDATANLYVIDAGNGCVRKVAAEPAHTVTTVAGRPNNAGFGDAPGANARFAFAGYPNGLAIDAQNNLYVADGGNQRIRKIALADITRPVTTIAGSGQAGAQDGPGATARFESPAGLALDGPGVLYVADAGGHRIRRIDLIDPTHPVTTLAGDGAPGFTFGFGTEARFNGPVGVAVNAYLVPKALYVADRGNFRIRRIGL